MSTTLDAYVAEHRRMARPDAPPDLVRLRDGALETFLSLGFPTTRQEDWRFTSVAPILEQPFRLAPGPREDDAAVAPFRLPGPVAAELVFVDGHFVPALSSDAELPAGARAGSLAGADAAPDAAGLLGSIAPADHPFVALNTAFLAGGVRLEIPAGTEVERPIHVLFVSTSAAADGPTMAHPRVLLTIGAGSRATVVESHAGPAGTRYFANAVSELVLGDDAALDHCTLQVHGDDALHMGAVHARLGRHARLGAHAVTLGGALARHEAAAVLDGEGAECALHGLYLADGRRLIDHHTTIDHAAPHASSRETYAGILAGRARGVFNGRIIVRADAQRTDAQQMNRALLLSEDAQINTNPQLEIRADDVKCTHGAAVGQIDEEAVFYLRARGVEHEEARRMLTYAFAADVLHRLPFDAIQTRAGAAVRARLARALPAAA